MLFFFLFLCEFLSLSLSASKCPSNGIHGHQRSPSRVTCHCREYIERRAEMTSLLKLLLFILLQAPLTSDAHQRQHHPESQEERCVCYCYNVVDVKGVHRSDIVSLLNFNNRPKYSRSLIKSFNKQQTYVSITNPHAIVRIVRPIFEGFFRSFNFL